MWRPGCSACSTRGRWPVAEKPAGPHPASLAAGLPQRLPTLLGTPVGATGRGCRKLSFPEGDSLHAEGEMLSLSICPARALGKGLRRWEAGLGRRHCSLMPLGGSRGHRACPTQVPFGK